MKIVFFSNSLSSTIRFRKWLIDRLILEGHEIVIISPEGDGKCIKNHNIQCYSIGLNRKSKSILNNATLMFDIFSILRKIDPDLVLSYTLKPALLSPIICRILKIPSISILTGLGSGFLQLNKGKAVVFKIINFLLYFANAIVVLNKYDRDYLFRHVGIRLNKIFVLPGEGVDTDFFQYNEPSHSPEFNFLFIGRLIKDKGIYELLGASEILNGKYSNSFCVTIVGLPDYGNPTTISYLNVEQIKKTPYIRYVEHTDNIERYIMQSDVFILPSYREGLSMSLLESCSIGRPAIVTNVPGLNDLVEDNVNGFLCPSGSTILLFESMEKILTLNKNELVTMGENSRAKVIDTYNLDSVYKVFLEILNSTKLPD